MSGGDRVGALVVAALPAELAAAKTAASLRSPVGAGVVRWEKRAAGTSVPYWWGEYRAEDGGSIPVALACPTGMGSRMTGPLATILLDRLRPSCVAMCGVCAGNPSDVALGDVVVAELTYEWDEGKHSRCGFQGDHRQIPADPRLLQVAQDLDPTRLPSFGEASPDEAMWWLLERLNQGQDPRQHPALRRYFPIGTWAPGLDRFENTGLIARDPDGTVRLTEAGGNLIRRRIYDDVEGPQRLPYRVLVGPMASGSAVMSDGRIWTSLQAMGVRTITAVDVEAATIATIAHSQNVPWLVVKGVMDHAGIGKDDRYKAFAARASAEVMYALLTQVPRNGTPDAHHGPAGTLPTSRATTTSRRDDPPRAALEAKRPTDKMTMTPGEIEKLVGPLPRSARVHRAQWGDDTKVQAQRWPGN